MDDLRLVIAVGTTVLTEHGLARVSRVDRYGVEMCDPMGTTDWIAWPDLGATHPIDGNGRAAVLESIRPAWDSLDDVARDEAIGRLEVVIEVRTGYRYGHSELALDGEPFQPFGELFGASLQLRCRRMAELLSHERVTDRQLQRRLHASGTSSMRVSEVTVYNWVKAWERAGLLGLVDGRRRRTPRTMTSLSPEFRRIAVEVVGDLDGDYSTVNHREILRRVRVRMRDQDEPVRETERQQRDFVGWLMQAQGRTTRAQRSTKLRTASGHRHYAALLPGQVVAVDVTRSDVLTFSPRTGRVISVEIISAIDVATRAILALRVVPMSADAQDACLLLYDVLRPFSQLVEGTSVSDWVWAGVPEALDFSSVVQGDDGGAPPAGRENLQGTHRIPGVLPAALRSDHGSIFVSAMFREQLHRLGIDLLLSRGKRPIDNPMIERFHETLQRGLQQLPGYKGRNVAERGIKVGKPGAHEDAPLLTPSELE